MKALTIRQPWAQLIAIGAKQIETRSWPTKHRGRIAIHAGMNQRNIGIDFWLANGGTAKPIHTALLDGGYIPSPAFAPHWTPNYPDDPRPVPLGAIVATANLVDCVPIVHVDEPWRGAEPYDADPDICVVYRDEAVWHKVGDTVSDMHDQFPFGEWLSGRWAWLLADAKPTTERCPSCWGDGGFQEDSMVLYGIHGGSDWSDPCPTCNPAGRRTEPLGVGAYGCDPIPAKGRQGPWEWTS